MKAVITVIGKDRVGIIHDVTGILASNDVNILNISQTILDNYFTMIMITDISKCKKSFEILRKDLVELGNSINMDIKIQHEEIFDSMHKI
jgi:ACT domain-containing protein